ncbi:DUF3445 domain-containing protein [Pontixanthobacter aestiaquae]|uniref:DUF3445 domain-containing protein n=1 Tax=Pontixanthobacter aestiaquae TaxID=1509367 RepID=A0A844Z8U0_9SPHN|nr:DUF3445 domain-containing protein [Pontixanthobacter aestiaquae]MDN3645630.1 DUF3445 domain-containing protein [Pontixanthobacter aestiaquae]MXO83373.1 DUF3445 domain-containing protein [Pontixanthobacter aestiaquae]
MGLCSLSEEEWLQPDPDLAARAAAFAADPYGVQHTRYTDEPGRELAAMLGVEGGLLDAAKAHHEDMCLLKKFADEDFYRLIGTAVAYPTDWHPKEKMGLPLTAMHEPIQGYAEQLASGVDHFMTKLKPGKIFGRCNWFIAPIPELRWIADEPAAVAYRHVTAGNAGETLFVRSERQTLRRLPETGTILFTIGVYVAPLSDLSRENVALLSHAMQDLLQGEGDRRGAPHYASYLIGYAAKQSRN